MIFRGGEKKGISLIRNLFRSYSTTAGKKLSRPDLSFEKEPNFNKRKQQEKLYDYGQSKIKDFNPSNSRYGMESIENNYEATTDRPNEKKLLPKRTRNLPVKIENRKDIVVYDFHKQLGKSIGKGILSLPPKEIKKYKELYFISLKNQYTDKKKYKPGEALEEAIQKARFLNSGEDTGLENNFYFKNAKNLEEQFRSEELNTLDKVMENKKALQEDNNISLMENITNTEDFDILNNYLKTKGIKYEGNKKNKMLKEFPGYPFTKNQPTQKFFNKEDPKTNKTPIKIEPESGEKRIISTIEVDSHPQIKGINRGTDRNYISKVEAIDSDGEQQEKLIGLRTNDHHKTTERFKN